MTWSKPGTRALDRAGSKNYDLNALLKGQKRLKLQLAWPEGKFFSAWVHFDMRTFYITIIFIL